jgi:hypothetical protein
MNPDRKSSTSSEISDKKSQLPWPKPGQLRLLKKNPAEHKILCLQGYVFGDQMVKGNPAYTQCHGGMGIYIQTLIIKYKE